MSQAAATHAVEPAETPLTPDSWGKLGMWIFLAGDAVGFGVLLSGYGVMRATSADWPNPYAVLGINLTAIMTFLLICSSVTMVKALEWLGKGDRRRAINYLLYTPAAFGRQPGRRWPLIVFLHGGGERGDDPQLLKAQPLPKTLAGPATFPAIVFSPQLPLRLTFWSDLIEPVDVLLRRLEAHYAVDKRRVYLTGLSTGGFGTWEYGLRHPRRFAALVPIAGGYDGGSAVPAGICALRNVPIWAFHGALDTIIPPERSAVLVGALRACGSKVVRFTLYAGVDHFGSWPRAYADPALWRWLFAQRLP